MAVTLINNFGIGATDFTAMMATINKSYKGKSEITLSNYDNDLAPAVKVGSVFDCNGAIYLVETTDETPSGYSSISNSTMFYLVFDESALSFVYTETAPTWSDNLQGWYNGNDRYFFSMYKDSGGTLYKKKALLWNKTDERIHNTLVIEGGEILTTTLKGTMTYDSIFNMLDEKINTSHTYRLNGTISLQIGTASIISIIYLDSCYRSGSDIVLEGMAIDYFNDQLNGYTIAATVTVTSGGATNVYGRIVF